jgi:co-chaperonin GroES (HSP10)
MRYDFNTSRLKGKVQISINNWVSPEENLLEIRKITGKSYVTYITKALAVGDEVQGINQNDYILLSKVACDIATTPTVAYEFEGEKYFNVPSEQILGVFNNNKVTLSELTLQNKNVLFKRVNKKQSSSLLIEETNTMLGEVIKVAEGSKLKVGDKIVVRDNVSTPIRFGELEFFITEEKFIVGVINKGGSIEDMAILNGYILMTPYISSHVLNSSILETPVINYEDLDYSDINNRNLFKVMYVDKTLKGIKEGDILLLSRDYTNYMYYENERYFVINEEKWISGKILERDRQ